MIQNNKYAEYIIKNYNYPDDSALEIVNQCNYEELNKDEYFVTAGSICDKRMFVDCGFLRSFIIDISGRDITTGFYSDSQIVSEPMSFFSQTKSKEYIQAITPCSGWSVNFEKMNHLFHLKPQIRELGRLLLLNDFVELKKNMISVLSEPAEFRYLNLLKKHPEIIKNVPLKFIASYLGITDTSLSRIRKQTAKKLLP